MLCYCLTCIERTNSEVYTITLFNSNIFFSILGKSYNNSTEEKFRMKIFMENKAKIAKHNHHAFHGKHTYTLKMNHYGDLLHHEFVATMNGYDMAAKRALR